MNKKLIRRITTVAGATALAATIAFSASGSAYADYRWYLSQRAGQFMTRSSAAPFFDGPRARNILNNVHGDFYKNDTVDYYRLSLDKSAVVFVDTMNTTVGPYAVTLVGYEEGKSTWSEYTIMSTRNETIRKRMKKGDCWIKVTYKGNPSSIKDYGQYWFKFKLSN